MQLHDFAHQILFGTTLEDKLVTADLRELEKVSPRRDPIAIPRFPGRPVKLARTSPLTRLEKPAFPSVHRLHQPAERGIVLHFFANHELLAMELMALMLLRFPAAPPAFRRGIGLIIQEEQNHLRLYIERMKELGVELGDIPVNDYFWNCLRNMHSPLDFTVQMSLTFEQANLDYSLFFMNAIARSGDTITAGILERVFREEIGHVKHGLTWFNRWRNSTESDWDAYLRLLPAPLNPRRAKGSEFCATARRMAGFSESFIQALQAHAGSKGRPPTLWLYNPYCESQIAREDRGFRRNWPPKSSRGILNTFPCSSPGIRIKCYSPNRHARSGSILCRRPEYRCRSLSKLIPVISPRRRPPPN